MRRPRRESRRGLRDQYRRAVVEHVPTGVGQQAVVQRDRTAEQVERAPPAAQVARGVGRGRADGATPGAQLQLQVAGGERPRSQPVAKRHAPRADPQPAARAGRRVGGYAHRALARGRLRRSVLEPAVGGVLESDQGRGEHLEARRAGAHDGGACGRAGRAAEAQR